MKHFKVLGMMAVGLTAVLCLGRIAIAVTDPGKAPDSTIDSTVGWTWSGMKPYANAAVTNADPHAGGPGSFGVYTFHGAAIQVYGMKCPSITVDGQEHKTGSVKISIDGKEQATVTLASTNTVSNFKVIGVSTLTDGNHVLQVDPVDGWVVINSVKVIDLPLSPVVPNHLVAYYTCDERAGETLTDKSGHGHTGYFQAGAAWAADAKIGKGALMFPSPGGVEINEPVIDTTSSFSVSAWVKLNTLDGFQTFVSIDGNYLSGFYLQLRNDSHQFAFTVHPTDGPSGPEVAVGNEMPQPGVWYHLVGAYDAASGTSAMFINGTLQSTQQLSRPWHADGHTAIGRGRWDSKFADFTTAEIDDVRFYDVALLPDQVQKLYESAH